MKLFWLVVGLWVFSELAAIAFYVWLFKVWLGGPPKA